MSVYLSIETKLDQRLAQSAMREAISMWDKTGKDIGSGLSGAISKAFGSFDSSAARREIAAMSNAYRGAADAEEAAAARMVASLGRVEAAQARLTEVTAKYGADSSKALAANAALADSHAVAAKAQRDHVDAMVAAEAGNKALADATDKSAAATGRAGQVWNAVGVASLATFGGALVATADKAANFQQSMEKLSAAAGMPADQLKVASDGILKMAGQVGYSAQDLSAAMFTISKAGYSASDGLKVLTASAQGANAEQAPLANVVDALTTSLHDFNIPADQANKVMSQMVTMAGQSKAPLDALAGALHTIEPAAAGAHLQLADVWGTLAQITQSGTSADQAADWMQNALRSLSNPQTPARDAMQQLGINADQVSQSLGQNGLAGTMQHLSDTVMAHFADANHVNVGELRNAAQAQENANEMIGAMSPAAQNAAKALQDGTMTHRQYQMTVRGSSEADAEKLKQFQTLQDKVDGFSSRFAKGRETLESWNQAMNDLTGTTSGAQVALQVTGDHAQETNDKIKAIADTTTEADGKVKGSSESLATLNGQMREAKAAFGAAAIEIGTAFVPVMTDAAHILKDVGGFMANHKTLVEDGTIAVGAFGAAWLLTKGYLMAKEMWTVAGTGIDLVKDKLGLAKTASDELNTTLAAAGPAAQTGATGVEAAAAEEVAAEERVTTSATEADTALSAGGKGAGLRGLRPLSRPGRRWEAGCLGPITL